jgi:hypothetical protein
MKLFLGFAGSFTQFDTAVNDFVNENIPILVTAPQFEDILSGLSSKLMKTPFCLYLVMPL